MKIKNQKILKVISWYTKHTNKNHTFTEKNRNKVRNRKAWRDLGSMNTLDIVEKDMILL